MGCETNTSYQVIRKKKKGVNYGFRLQRCYCNTPLPTTSKRRDWQKTTKSLKYSTLVRCSNTKSLERASKQGRQRLMKTLRLRTDPHLSFDWGARLCYLWHARVIVAGKGNEGLIGAGRVESNLTDRALRCDWRLLKILPTHAGVRVACAREKEMYD